jgi:MOSC domain-containing protein YiiM
MIQRFLDSGRSGFYFSVIEPGEVRPGSGFEIVACDPNEVTVAEIQSLYLGKTSDPELLQRAARVSALPLNWKAALQQRRAPASE